MPHPQISAVLVSGGLDSVVLLAEEALAREVQPIYVSTGLAWESAERTMLTRCLVEMRWAHRLHALISLDVNMKDVYSADHWAVVGHPPGYHTPDEDVYLHGRNIVLLGKAAVFCATRQIERLVLGTLDHNPFPDATPDFRAAMATALSLGLGHPLIIDAPFARTSKAEVIRRGVALAVPLALTLSCMNPLVPTKGAMPRHCGLCSKCRERRDAFLHAGEADPTDYADLTHVGSGVY